MLYFDYKKCEHIIKNHSSSFYKAFSKVKNKHKRKGIYAVYAFCRTADDLVDEHEDFKALEAFEREFKLFLDGKYKQDYLWNVLNDVFKRYDLNEQAFLDMIEGQRMDKSITRYETFDQLLSYCYHVASTVGLMITPILSEKNHHKLKECSTKLGYAMQLTNILRDIGEDI